MRGLVKTKAGREAPQRPEENSGCRAGRGEPWVPAHVIIRSFPKMAAAEGKAPGRQQTQVKNWHPGDVLGDMQQKEASQSTRGQAHPRGAGTEGFRVASQRLPTSGAAGLLRRGAWVGQLARSPRGRALGRDNRGQHAPSIGADPPHSRLQNPKPRSARCCQSPSEKDGHPYAASRCVCC